MRQTLVIALLSLMSACGFNPFARKDSKNRIEYFVHGDPLQLIEGSTQDLKSFLKVDDLAKFNGFHAANAVAFIEQEPKEAPQPFSQVEEANDTAASDEQLDSIFEIVPYEFEQISETAYDYKPTVDPDRNYTLNFTVTDGVLELTGIDDKPVSIQHYSIKTDGSAMSFLLSYQHSHAGKVLLNIAFADSSLVNPLTRATEGYAYLIDTVELKWPGPMSIKACGSFSDAEKASLNESTSRWLSDPKQEENATTVPVAFEFTNEFPPFSDVNSQCIHLIHDFRLEASDVYYAAGVTLPTINSASKAILDSDIFLFMDHAPVARQFNGKASTVLMHELGHFFGLGHEFRTDPVGAPLNPSIMAYSRATSYISEWDFAAVHALYGGYLTAGTGP